MVLQFPKAAPTFLLKPDSNACDIVVLGHNRADMSAQCLQQLFSIDHGVPTTITFVDNASTDRTRGLCSWYKRNTSKWIPWARYKGKKFRVIRNKKNHGFSEANNRAAKFGRSPWICFLNNDTILPDENRWLGCLIACAVNNSWAAVGPVSNAVLGIQDQQWNSEWPFYHRAKFLSGFCFVIRRDYFNLINGWDEQFFYGDEDLDISIRLRKMGWQIGVNRMVNVTHLNQATMSVEAEKQGIDPQQWYARTRQQLTVKWGEANVRDLFIWPELTVPHDLWRDYGVLPDGFFSFFPGTPKDGLGSLHELRSRSASADTGRNATGAPVRELLAGYRFAGNDDVYRAAFGDSSDCGKLELCFKDTEEGCKK